MNINDLHYYLQQQKHIRYFESFKNLHKNTKQYTLELLKFHIWLDLNQKKASTNNLDSPIQKYLFFIQLRNINNKFLDDVSGLSSDIPLIMINMSKNLKFILAKH